MRGGNLEGQGGSGILIRELRSDARKLSPDEFEDRHGRAYLLLSAAALAMPRGASTTEVQLGDESPMGVSGEATAALSLLVFPVRRSGRSAGHLITIGRAPNNDVVIPDLSISRFHAFVKEGGGGTWMFQDAGSTNGTTVNGVSVPRQGHGAPLELKSGDNLHIGQVDLTFLSVDALLNFALKLGG